MPAPWSRMMFVSEIVKPTSVCLGAFVDDALVAYVIVSRYVDAWHVMNLVVAPEYRRQGIATRLLATAVRPGRRGEPPRLHARGAGLERRRDRALREPRLPRPGHPPRLLHRQPRGRADHVEGTARAVILGLETSCDETAAALITREGEIRSNVVASQAALHARFGGVVPEVASRRAPRARRRRSSARRSARRARRSTTSSSSRSRPARGWSARCSSASRPRRRWRGGGACRSRRSTICTGTSPRSTSRREPLEPPFLCLLATGGHTLLLDVRDRGGYRTVGTTIDDAAGEAFDKGARLLGLGYPGGAALDRLAADGDAEAFDFPVARLDGLDFSFSGVKTALLYVVRDLAAGRARAPSRRPGGELPARNRPRARGAARGRRRTSSGTTGSPSSAASRRTRSSAPRSPRPRSRRSQLCTDNAAMIASAARFVEPLASPGYLDLDAHAAA